MTKLESLLKEIKEARDEFGPGNEWIMSKNSIPVDQMYVQLAFRSNQVLFLSLAFNNIEKLAKACEVMKEALEKIKYTNAAWTFEDRGIWNYQFDANQAIEQVKRILET